MNMHIIIFISISMIIYVNMYMYITINQASFIQSRISGCYILPMGKTSKKDYFLYGTWPR